MLRLYFLAVFRRGRACPCPGQPFPCTGNRERCPKQRNRSSCRATARDGPYEHNNSVGTRKLL